MDCDCSVTTTAGVAFVGVRLRNPTPVARRVRVENRLAGPVCPPRTEGVPSAGWDETGVSVVVQPHETRPLGYACPLDAQADAPGGESSQADPPAEVVADERVADDDGRVLDADDHDRSVHSVVRDLGRPAPPRDAVPPPALGSTVDGEAETDGSDPPGEIGALDANEAPDIDAETDDDPVEPDDDPPTPDDPPTADDTLPAPVTSWLAEVERRIETAERLEPDTSVSTATAAVAERDCPPADLAARLDADHRTLRALAERLDRLGERAESASVPADHLRRLS